MIISLLVMAQVSLAGKMYQWEDEFGVTHFTDNLFNVPYEYRESSERELNDYGAIKSDGLASQEGGITIWQAKCKECHFLDDENDKDSLGLKNLSGFLTDKRTDDVVDAQLLGMALSDALSKKHDQFLNKTLSQDEISNLSAYLTERQHKIIIESPENL